jgi:hypothetical protein
MKGSSDERIKAVLGAVDWNFPAATTLATSVHSLHWFPGNFIPQIPSFLIQALSSPGDLVADPFCGSGTTGVEAVLIGRRGWLSDSNAVSSLITRAKILLLTDPVLRSRFSEWCAPVMWQSLSPKRTLSFLEAPQSVSDWFHPDTFVQLNNIWSAIESIENDHCRAVLQMSFSETLFSCASAGRPTTSGGGKRRHHWGWIADNVKPKSYVWHDARRLFQSSVEKTEEVMCATPLFESESLQFQVADARAIPLASNSVDLVVTSPPYLGMIDYANANRLTYNWFSLEMAEDRRSEIGARARRNNLSEPSSYLQAIRLSVAEMTRILKSQRFCAVVIGSSRKFPNMAERVLDIFSEHLRVVFGPVSRMPTRRRVSSRQGTPPNELVCVFRKVD